MTTKQQQRLRSVSFDLGTLLCNLVQFSDVTLIYLDFMSRTPGTNGYCQTFVVFSSLIDYDFY